MFNSLLDDNLSLDQEQGDRVASRIKSKRELIVTLKMCANMGF